MLMLRKIVIDRNNMGNANTYFFSIQFLSYLNSLK